MTKLLTATLWLVFLSFSCNARNNPLNIVVSIKPIHSLTAFICQGVTTPILLIKGNDSPHTQALTPNQIQVVQQADLVIWVGKNYEALWGEIIDKQGISKKALTLIKVKGLTLYPYRQRCRLSSPHGNHNHDSHDHTIDGHIWLDPTNARAIAEAIAEKLIQIDSSHEKQYRANLSRLLKELAVLEFDLISQASRIIKKPYIVYHDGLQYFDNFFGFQMAASLVIEPDLPPNAQDYLVLKDWLSKTPIGSRAVCIFMELAFQEGFSKKLAEEFGLKHQTIDYLGIEIPEGPQAYSLMMRQLMTDFVTGLS